MTNEVSFQDCRPAFYIRHEYAVVLFFTLIWQIVLLCVSNGRFVEIDSYTHALRLTDFIQSGSWRETLYRHDNCPDGQMLHFSRITDMFLFLTTLPFLSFTELKRAVLFGGFLYNPLIACLSAVALIRLTRPCFTPMVRATGVLFYFLQGFVLSLFQAGRPDHHVLLNLFLIILSGCLLLGAKTQKTAYYKTAGLFGGLAVWASPEGFLSGLFIYAGLVTAWLCKYQNIRQIRLFSQYFFIGTAVCLLVDPPMQGLLYPDNSRLSVLMVIVSGFSFLSFYLEERLKRKYGTFSFFKRLFSLSFAAAFFFGIVLCLFDEKTLFSWPISPRLQEIWAVHVSELKPGFSGHILNGPAAILFYTFLIGCIVFPFASRPIQKSLITIDVPVFLFFIITLISQRFGRPASAFSVYVLLMSVHVFTQNIIKPSPRFLIRTRTTVLFLFLCLYANSVFMACKIQKKFETLTIDPSEYSSYIPRNRGCVLTGINQGPEIAWATGEAVIGSPYHTNPQGIIDTHTLLNTSDVEEFQALLKKRNIRTILALKSSAGKDSVLKQIITGETTFCFIRSVFDSPKENKEKNLLIYYVDFDACETNKTANAL